MDKALDISDKLDLLGDLVGHRETLKKRIDFFYINPNELEYLISLVEKDTGEKVEIGRNMDV